MHRCNSRAIFIALCACLPLVAVVDGEEPAHPKLQLRGGGHATGTLLASDDPAVIAWHADGFVQPFHFPLAAVQSLQYPKTPSGAPGAFCFEFTGGDLLTGEFRSLNDREVVLDVAGLGKVVLERAELLRFYRGSGADLIYHGPNGLEGWIETGVDNGWRDDGGQLRSESVGAVIGRNDRPPALVRYELELAWADKPNFEFAAGLSVHAEGRTAFRLETWGDALVVTRESDSEAEVAELQKIAPGTGSVALSVLFDEARGQLLVYSAAGEVLADFTVAPDKNPPKALPKVRVAPLAQINPKEKTKPPTPTGLLLTNRGGPLSLQRLAIRRWSGIAPKPAAAGQASLHLTENKTRTAEVRAFDAEARQLEIVVDGKSERIDEALLQHVVLRSRDEAQPRSVHLLLASGTRLSGEIEQIKQDALLIRSPIAKEVLTVPVKELQAVVFRHADMKPAKPTGSPIRVEIAGASLRGNLQTAKQTADSCLVFQPSESTTASPLTADANGKFIFREPAKPLPEKLAAEPESAVGQMVNGLRNFMKAAKPGNLIPRAPGDCLLHLRTGDTVPCQVQFIDERGVTFTSQLSKVGFVAHDRIQALELRTDAPPVKIEKTRFDRLLTLPRMQRNNPPEQLIRSLQGDYLRGRLVAMNDKELQIEMRLDSKKLTRDQVTRILWLHPDETAKATVVKPAEPPKAEPINGIRVQAISGNGRRLTFFAQEFTGKMLSGRSELLGDCQVEINDTDQLLIGAEIEKAASSLAFHQWRLHAAPEPLPDPEPNGDPGSGEGMESVLVGKPAPAIELERLTGGKFKLTDLKDKVVVLDFWASWCGPCLQAMPQIDKVAAEFEENGVKLIAINLGETPDQIKTVLTRLKLKTDVVLDTDGRIAERYGANDIPQTVIIGRDGKVARLFVGAGSRFDEKLRQALKAVLAN